jgi:hypothetical protein
MLQKIHNRKAISTVLTTLIILVASVVLGTGVVLYGTSLFQTNAQSSSISATGIQVWVNSTDTNNVAWGAADVRNSGDKLLSVDKIVIRGTDIPFANWFADSDPTRITTANFQTTLNYTKTNSTGYMKDSTATGATFAQGTGNACPSGAAVLKIDLDRAAGINPGLCLSQQSGPVALKPGDKAIIYFRVSNGVLSPVDAGSSSSVALYAGQVGSPTTVTIASK